MRVLVSHAYFFALAACQSVPTVTFGPLSNYQQAPAITASPTGREIIITPDDLGSGIPLEGIDFFFGPDVQAELSTALQGVCAGDLTPDCVNALTGFVNNEPTLDIERRLVGLDDLLVAGAFGAAYVAYLAYVALYLLTKEDTLQHSPISYLHVPSTDLSQIQSQTTSSMIVATAADASMLITLSASTSTAPTPASVTTYSSDRASYHSGDVVVTLPTRSAELFHDLVDRFADGSCDAQPQQRAPGPIGSRYAALDRTVQLILGQVGQDTLLDLFGQPSGPPLPVLRDTALQVSRMNARAYAATLDSFRGIANDLRDLVSDISWLGTFQQYCEDFQISLTITLRFEDRISTTCPPDAPSGIDAPQCNDPDCLGEQLVDVLCHTGPWYGCPCIASTKLYYQPGLAVDWESGQLLIDGLLSETGWSCDSANTMTLETDAFEKLVDAFCKDASLNQDYSKDILATDAGVDGYNDYKFNFAWKNKDSTCAAASCSDIFKAFDSSNQCSWNSHTKATSGTQDLTCGTASFQFRNEPEICRLQFTLDQWPDKAGELLPFYIKLATGRDPPLTDGSGNSLQAVLVNAASDGYVQCGAASPCQVDSLLQNPVMMRPILPSDSTDKIPYVRIDIGDQGWDGKFVRPETDTIPGCDVSMLQKEDGSDRQIYVWDCHFPCAYGGGEGS